MKILTKRTISLIAIFTLLIAMLMPTMVNAESTPIVINTLNISIASPKAGETVTVTEETTEYGIAKTPDKYPTVTLDNNANYDMDYKMYIKEYPTSTSEADAFAGTFEAGKYYYVEVSLKAKDGYVFAGNSDMALKVNGETTNFQLCSWNGSNTPWFMFYAKVKATGSSEEKKDTASETTTTTYKVLNGESQKVSRGKAMQFRFDIEYAKFQESGKVYVDGKEVDSKNYTTKEGSTIITFNKNFTNSLKAGKHTLKVAVADGEVSTNFTITKNPATGDNIAIYAGIAIVSLISLSIVLAIRKFMK